MLPWWEWRQAFVLRRAVYKIDKESKDQAQARNEKQGDVEREGVGCERQAFQAGKEDIEREVCDQDDYQGGENKPCCLDGEPEGWQRGKTKHAGEGNAERL